MTDVGQLCDGLGSAAATDRLRMCFADWWSSRDPQAQDLLDELAIRAPQNTDAMGELLWLLDEHGIARTALHRVLINAEDVADAEQTTLAAVAFKIDQFRARSRFSTWVHQIARNEAKMLLRARSRRPSDPVPEVHAEPFLARLSTLLASRDAVDQALASLDERYRRPIELREIDGLEYHEIANLLDVPIGTVRSRLSRGRALLVQSLSP